nr:MAG TPA: hypothetical protein [Inoviridae sp.]
MVLLNHQQHNQLEKLLAVTFKPLGYKLRFRQFFCLLFYWYAPDVSLYVVFLCRNPFSPVTVLIISLRSVLVNRYF